MTTKKRSRRAAEPRASQPTPKPKGRDRKNEPNAKRCNSTTPNTGSTARKALSHSASNSVSPAKARRQSIADFDDRSAALNRRRNRLNPARRRRQHSALNSAGKAHLSAGPCFARRRVKVARGRLEKNRIKRLPIGRFTIPSAYAIYLKTNQIDRNTAIKDQSYYRNLCSHFGKRKLSRIGVGEIAQYREALQLRPGRRSARIAESSVNNYIAFFKKITSNLWRAGYCYEKPYAPKIKSPTWSTPILHYKTGLRLLEMARLDHDQNAYLLFALTYFTVSKAAIVLRLRRTDFDVGTRTIALPPSKRSAKSEFARNMRVPVPRALMPELRAALRRANGPLLLHRDGRPILETKYYLRRARERLIEKLQAEKKRARSALERQHIEQEISKLKVVTINCLRDVGIAMLLQHGFPEGLVSALSRLRFDMLSVRFAASRFKGDVA